MNRNRLILGGLMVFLLTLPAYSLSGTVWSEVKDNIAYVYHDDAYFNCCPDMAFEIVRDAGTIDIYERDLGTNPCLCMCYFDFTHNLEGLAPGTYLARVWEASNEDEYTLAGVTTFTVKIQTSAFKTSSLSSECHDAVGDKPSRGDELLLESSILPAQSTVNISYYLPRTSQVSITIYDATGTRVRFLNVGHLSQGEHLAVWDTRSDSGQRVSRGIYFIRLKAGDEVRTLPLVILK